MFYASICRGAQGFAGGARLPEVMITVMPVVGLPPAYLFSPGHGMNIDPSTLDAKVLNTYADNAPKLQGARIGSLLLNIIPTVTTVEKWPLTAFST
jgi:Na+/H+-dicarboxylate symporter